MIWSIIRERMRQFEQMKKRKLYSPSSLLLQLKNSLFLEHPTVLFSRNRTFKFDCVYVIWYSAQVPMLSNKKSTNELQWHSNISIDEAFDFLTVREPPTEDILLIPTIKEFPLLYALRIKECNTQVHHFAFALSSSPSPFSARWNYIYGRNSDKNMIAPP